MALVRVYCGISSAADASHAGMLGRLTLAIVDDSGRLLEYCEINDDPTGYAVVTALLAERFGGTTTVTMAVDSDDHLVSSLLAAAGRPIAYADDDDTVDEWAEQFGHDESMDEVHAPAAERRAVGLARALQAGAVSAGVVPAPREFANLKPILAAHAALAVGRNAAAVALREVLRELYPAALRAYPDPASPVALAMLDALPEPGLLNAAAGKGRDAAVTVAARLVADGVCGNDTALEAVSALRAAITETPRRNGVTKQLTSSVSEAVRASVAAVRSSDAAMSVLIHALAERVAPAAGAVKAAAPRRRVAAPAPITTPAQAPRPVAPPPIAPVPVSPAPVAPQPIAAQIPVVQPIPVVAAVPILAPQARPAWAQSTPPPMPPGFEPTPVTGTPIVPRSAPPVIPAQRSAPPAPPAPADPLGPFVPTITHAAINNERAARGLGTRPQEPITDPGSRANWPLVGDPEEQVPVSSPPKSTRVTPPWQADDLVLPPSLRLVEPLNDPVSVPTTRLVDDTALTSRIPKPRRTERNSSSEMSDDTDLLIFASVSSAWFNGIGDDESEGESTWNSSMDLGWRAAEEASLRPSKAGDTDAGLPRRVPAANLVPGSPIAAPERPLRIVRDAGEIAAHTSSYFRGYRRGNQEAGGYSVGGRPGRESAAGWDFSREHELRDERGDYPQRAVNYR